MNLNKILITGNLTADPELRYTPNGKAVLSASLANNEYYTDAQGQEQKVTTFVNLEVWNKPAENFSTGRQRLCHSVPHARTTTQFFFDMNNFQSKREEKADRFRELAEQHENISTGRHFAARQQLEMIPLGQPILVGHHSEKRHRSHLKRIDQHFAKAQEHHEKAEHYRRRVTALESNRAIFSDDPDATENLVDKIDRLNK